MMFTNARASFGETELVNLTLAIIAINGWNRLAISFRTVPGTYQRAGQDDGRTGTHSPPAQKVPEGQAADD